MSQKYICPICGYSDLNYEPFDKSGNPSDTICSCCGYQFGYELSRPDTNLILQLRQNWISKNCPFFDISKPKNWELESQLKNTLEIDLDKNYYNSNG
jgi:hypothetical protein